MLYVIPFIILLVVAVILKNARIVKTKYFPKNINRKSGKKRVLNQAKVRVKNKSQGHWGKYSCYPSKQSCTWSFATQYSTAHSRKTVFSSWSSSQSGAKKDNTQHELYLLLLEIHIAQKDEFAIQQLISHIRSLGLNEIAAQAEIRQKNMNHPDNLMLLISRKLKHMKNRKTKTQRLSSMN